MYAILTFGMPLTEHKVNMYFEASFNFGVKLQNNVLSHLQRFNEGIKKNKEARNKEDTDFCLHIHLNMNLSQFHLT